MSRKIVIHKCSECPYKGHRGGYAPISYIPECEKAGRELPYTVEGGGGMRVYAKPGDGIPDWCPLEVNDDQADS